MNSSLRLRFHAERLLFAFALSGALAGCGGGGSAPSGSKPVDAMAVSISRSGGVAAATRLGPSAPNRPKLAKAYGKLPLAFEVNRGQTDSSVRFLARGAGYTLFLTGDDAVLALRSQKSGDGRPESGVRRRVVRRQLSVVSCRQQRTTDHGQPMSFA